MCATKWPFAMSDVDEQSKTQVIIITFELFINNLNLY